MSINFHVTGKERKALVEALSEITFSEAAYAGAPTFAYRVGDYTVDKNGVIFYPPTLAQGAVALVVEKLKERGFIPEGEAQAELPEEDAPAEIPAETPDVAPEAAAPAQPEAEAMEAAESAERPDTAEEGEADPAKTDETDDAPEVSEDLPDDENDTEKEPEVSAVRSDDAPDGTAEDVPAAEAADNKLTVSIPRKTLTDDALERLKLIVSNKEMLFKRAVIADSLPIEVTEEEVAFPWFTLTGVDGEAAAYAQFITALCQMASEQTRILDKPYDGDNDRFAMRIFMVRLGMKGAAFALARKLMMKHLTGNSGWRYGAPPKGKAETAEKEEANVCD